MQSRFPRHILPHILPSESSLPLARFLPASEDRPTGRWNANASVTTAGFTTIVQAPYAPTGGATGQRRRPAHLPRRARRSLCYAHHRRWQPGLRKHGRCVFMVDCQGGKRLSTEFRQRMTSWLAAHPVEVHQLVRSKLIEITVRNPRIIGARTRIRTTRATTPP